MRLIAPFTFIYDRCWLKKIINDVPSQNTFHCLLFKKYFYLLYAKPKVTQISWWISNRTYGKFPTHFIIR